MNAGNFFLKKYLGKYFQYRIFLLLKNNRLNILGFLGKIGDVFHIIEYHTSNAPEIVGKRFEDHVENLFSKQYFKLVEKTHSFKTNADRYVESSKNPDLIFEYIPTRENLQLNVNTGLNLISKIN